MNLSIARHRNRRNVRRNRRCACRPLARQLNRTCLRSLSKGRRGPDDLSQALRAFTRAIRCHRRLARLAPRFFDSTVVNQEVRHRAEQRRWMVLWEPALAKVYGHDPATCIPDSPVDQPPLPSRRTQQAVERELAGWEFWMAAGRLAMQRHQQRRPHALLSFRHLARLLEIASDLKLLACGQPAPPSPSFESRCADFMADLERAYPQHESPDPHLPNPTPGPAAVTSAGNAFPPATPPATVGPAESSPPTSKVSPVASTMVRPPPDNRSDLIPHALVIGAHGLLTLQR